MQKEKQVNLLEYDYPNEAVSEIPGKLLYAVIQFLKQVKDSEVIPVSFISQYPKSSKEVYNEKDKDLLERVDVKWEDYKTATSYFNQTPVEATTMTGAMATDLLLLTQQIHLDNIEKGIAVQVGTFKEDVKDAVELS